MIQNLDSKDALITHRATKLIIAFILYEHFTNDRYSSATEIKLKETRFKSTDGSYKSNKIDVGCTIKDIWL